MQPVITPQDLLPHLEDPKWAIVDCTFDLNNPRQGEADYLKTHIPGAVYADLERDLSALPNGKNGRHPLPSPEDLARVFSRVGIDEDSTVVAYDRNGAPYAARLWWSLQYLGGSKLAVLDGGLDAWVQAGYPVRSGAEMNTPARFVPAVQSDMLVTTPQIGARLGSGEDLLLDARAPERYRGEEEPYDPVAGRIPGAANFDWEDNLDENGRFKSPAALREQYERVLGAHPSSAVVAYCGSGVTSCHLLLAMAHAGIGGGRLYAGSWSEWCSDPTRPIAVGVEPSLGESEAKTD